MTVTIKETKPSEIVKLKCPYCETAINSFWIKKHSKLSGITTKCKRCGKTLEITVE